MLHFRGRQKSDLADAPQQYKRLGERVFTAALGRVPGQALRAAQRKIVRKSNN